MRHITIENVTITLALAIVGTIAASPTVAGMAARISIPLFFYYAGLIDESTLRRIAEWSAF